MNWQANSPRVAWKNFVAKLTDVVLVIAALVVVTVLVRREVIERSQSRVSAAPRSVENWQRFVADGHLIGAASARVKVVAFSDFQCGACAYMHDQVREMLSEYATQMAVVYRHLPLPIHPAAVTAALAAECAADQGKFEPFSAALFRDQHLIGVNSWEDFARLAEVPDLPQFDRCVRERKFIDRIKGDIAMARELDVHATPTFLVDGALLSGPTGAQLKERVRKAIDGHKVASRPRQN